MLENSFIHLPGIGYETEERLWNEGVRNWSHLEERVHDLFGPKRASEIARALDECRAAYEARELAYFRFKGADMWRLLPTLLSNPNDSSRIAYLDIETEGLGFPPHCRTTTIAVYFDGKLHLEHTKTGKFEVLRRIENEALYLVTFNGVTFDLPFLRREFGLKLAQPHLDLRYWLGRLGYKGGLKAIQQNVPGVRQRDSMDIDGFDAVRLWALHKRGVPNALETLLTYNAEDTVVLEQLVFAGLKLEAERRRLNELAKFECPPSPPIPTEVCPHVYRMLRG